MTDFGKEFKSFARSNHHIPTTTIESYVDHNILNMTPNIIEERKMNAVAMDVFSRLMMDRIIYLGTGVDSEIANIIQAQLLFLQSSDPKKDITMYINSPGGSVYAGFGMIDTMELISPDVSTICTGIAASMGAVLLAVGTKGKRAALKHSRIMIHQVSSGTQGQLSDMEIALKETIKVRNELYQVLCDSTGKDMETITRDCDRDNWMTSKEAVEYGLIDEVLTKN